MEDTNEQTSLPVEEQPETAPKQGSEDVQDGSEDVVTDSPVSDKPESSEGATDGKESTGDGSSIEQPVPQDQAQQPVPIQEPIPEAPEGFEEIPVQFTTYESNSFLLTVKYEMTLGDILVSTLMAFIVVIMLVRFFHSLILGRDSH